MTELPAALHPPNNPELGLALTGEGTGAGRWSGSPGFIQQAGGWWHRCVSNPGLSNSFSLYNYLTPCYTLCHTPCPLQPQRSSLSQHSKALKSLQQFIRASHLVQGHLLCVTCADADCRNEALVVVLISIELSWESREERIY